jgi:acyl carrier protein phosphodiesterase
MKKNDWLGGYANIDGIERTLIGLSSRVQKGEQMARSKAELIKYYDELSDNFDKFFPLLKKECHSFLNDLKN